MPASSVSGFRMTVTVPDTGPAGRSRFQNTSSRADRRIQDESTAQHRKKISPFLLGHTETKAMPVASISIGDKGDHKGYNEPKKTPGMMNKTDRLINDGMSMFSREETDNRKQITVNDERTPFPPLVPCYLLFVNRCPFADDYSRFSIAFLKLFTEPKDL